MRATELPLRHARNDALNSINAENAINADG
jgi:hypothetical protein